MGLSTALLPKSGPCPILAEGTRVLAAQNISRIRASTDHGNTSWPKRRRAGYVNFERSLTMTGADRHALMRRRKRLDRICLRVLRAHQREGWVIAHRELIT